MPATPDLSVSVGGAPLPAEAARALASVLVRQALDAPALAEIVLAEPPADWLAGLEIGAPVAVAVGGAALFAGDATVIEHEREAGHGRVLRLRAYDALHRLRKRQSLRGFPDTTAAELAEALTRGLVDGVWCAAAPPRSALVIQHEGSDLDLLVEQAALAGLHLALDSGTLRLLTLAGDGQEPLPLRLGRELVSVRAWASAEPMRRATRTRGWDVSRVATAEAGAGSARQDEVELRAVGLDAFPEAGARELPNRQVWSQEAAGALAQADMDRAAAAATAIEGVAEGDPSLRPGRVVRVEGVAPALDGAFVLTGASHCFEAATGYTTGITTAPPARPAAAQTPAVTPGRVLSTTDPEGLLRVRAELSAYGGVASGWMPVVLAGAGAGKGVLALPEPGDSVLVLLPGGDPARGIVLGGLLTRPPERSPAGLRSLSLRSPGGQSLVLDAEAALARLATSAGDVLELAPGGARLRATRDLVVEAPGHTLTFRAARVDFEKG